MTTLTHPTTGETVPTIEQIARSAALSDYDRRALARQPGESARAYEMRLRRLAQMWAPRRLPSDPPHGEQEGQRLADSLRRHAAYLRAAEGIDLQGVTDATGLVVS